MLRTSLFAFALAASAAVASAQQCQGKQTMCAEDDKYKIMYCIDNMWTTQNCKANEYCMTMNGGGMIHCMEDPDAGMPTATATEHEESSKSDEEKSDKSEEKSETSKDSGSGSPAIKPILAAIAPIAGLAAALF